MSGEPPNPAVRGGYGGPGGPDVRDGLCAYGKSISIQISNEPAHKPDAIVESAPCLTWPKIQFTERLPGTIRSSSDTVFRPALRFLGIRNQAHFHGKSGSTGLDMPNMTNSKMDREGGGARGHVP